MPGMMEPDGWPSFSELTDFDSTTIVGAPSLRLRSGQALAVFARAGSRPPKARVLRHSIPKRDFSPSFIHSHGSGFS
jgi:hypothetical protein